MNKTVTNRSKTDVSDKVAEVFYSSLCAYVKILFDEVKVGLKLDYYSVYEKLKTMWVTVRHYRRNLICAQQCTEPAGDENYLASHTARVTIIALIIGAHIKLPNFRLIELGVAALLHDIGMLKLSPEIYLSGRALTAQERKLIHTHTIQSYKLLNPHSFPLAVRKGVLEHHERENGSGYPLNFTGDKISLYGKIIAIADSYAALSEKRLHKNAKDHYTGILELLKNEGKQYDNSSIRSLVYSLSIYPVGEYVLLSNGQKGQVVDVNPENPHYPIVEIRGIKLLIETSPYDIFIISPIANPEIKEGFAA